MIITPKTTRTRLAAALVLALPALLAPVAASAQAARIEVGAPNFRPLPIAIAPFQADPAA